MKKKLSIQQPLMSNCEKRNENDIRLWFRIKSVDKKINSLGKIGSKHFDWLRWEELTQESANLYSQLSVNKDIVANLVKKYG